VANRAYRSFEDFSLVELTGKRPLTEQPPDQMPDPNRGEHDHEKYACDGGSDDYLILGAQSRSGLCL
jgi:hypothetical protein